MGSGGGGTFFPSNPENKSLQKLIEDAKEQAERDRSEGAVNEYLNRLLVTMNARDVDDIRSKLDGISGALEDAVHLEPFLFGGSVAKHTYVDGLSDVDALAVINQAELAEKSPAHTLRLFYDVLKRQLTYDDVKTVEKGKLAVTVLYRDGTEIQLLPAVRSKNQLGIASADGSQWSNIRPKAFQEELTTANRQLGNMLVPTIKLAKSLVSAFPKQKQISGYHLEALAVDVFRGYSGKKTPKELLSHFCEHAAARVLHPIKDITGQSSTVDEALCGLRSPSRRLIADAFQTAARQLRAATSVAQWKNLLEE